jgi:hypothetical protein
VINDGKRKGTKCLLIIALSILSKQYLPKNEAAHQDLKLEGLNMHNDFTQQINSLSAYNLRP